MGLFTAAISLRGVPARSASPIPVASRQAATDGNHLFANNVRFLSMVAIVGIHCLETYPCFHLPQIYLIQPLKFGTIAFFLVAGFLFGERIDRDSSLRYYGRRLKNVFLPWSFWYLVYCGFLVAAAVWHGRISLHSGNLLHQVGPIFSFGLLNTAYWFVPNLLVALAVLLIFRRVLKDIRMGGVFLLLSLFYAINIYGHWIAEQHPRAVFGFVFYLWLGAWGSWHFSTVEKWLSRISPAVMMGLVLLTTALALGEAKLLLSLHSSDPTNSLRITNQLFSVVVVLAIMKLRHAVWPRFVDVRAHTFGLYLTHTAALALCGAILVRLVPPGGPAHFWSRAPGMLVLLVTIFGCVYGGCLLLVRLLLSCRWLRWTVGLAGRGRTDQARALPQALPSAGEWVRPLASTAQRNFARTATLPES
ncbi:MAG TPA: acyltransferase [Acidobacteriaceae bacterium]|jgi:hypothetical protein|nr:acyltransferase [Acidobacteriaceae bacterium]